MVKMRGFDKLLKKLNRLAKSDARAAQRKATRAGTSVLLKAVRAETPKDDGALRRAQTSKVVAKGTGASGIVGADVAKLESDERRPSNVDWLVEYGHVAPDGTFVPPSGHMRRAADQAMPQAEAAYVARLKSEIERAASR
jgi:HK97 gp10 family phage protein